MGAACKAGRDKLTFVISPEIAPLGSWIEQLVAESTGKEGKGIVPVDGEPLGAPEVYGNDRLFAYLRFGDGDAKQDAAVAALEAAGHPVVRIAVDTREALGREFFRWEMATAIAGATLGVNPFDEPNVTEAKLATGALLDHLRQRREAAGARARRRLRGDAISIASRAHLASAGPGDYLAFCAYFLRTPTRDAALDPAARRLPRPLEERDHRRLRPALPALDRPAAQGGPEHGRLPAVDGRRRRRPAGPSDPGRGLQLRDACGTRRRWAICRSCGGAAGAPCASTWAPTSTPVSRRWPTRWPAGGSNDEARDATVEKIAVPAALPNPLREGLVEERIPEPATMVIFGASGDLARRKLLPALYSLTRDRLLPARFAVLGFAPPRPGRRRLPRGDAARLRRVRAPAPGRRRALDARSRATSSTSRGPTTIRRRSSGSRRGSRRLSASWVYRHIIRVLDHPSGRRLLLANPIVTTWPSTPTNRPLSRKAAILEEALATSSWTCSQLSVTTRRPSSVEGDATGIEALHLTSCARRPGGWRVGREALRGRRTPDNRRP